MACTAGDELGKGANCKESCLDRVECVVEEVSSWGSIDELKVPVAKCPAAQFAEAEGCGENCPCWRIVPRDECATGHGPAFGLEILRADNQPVEPNTVDVAYCPTSALTWGSSELLALGQCL